MGEPYVIPAKAGMNSATVLKAVIPAKAGIHEHDPGKFPNYGVHGLTFGRLRLRLSPE
jgi:hypothetical protein